MPLLCDVKEIRPSLKRAHGLDAYAPLREDLRDLRKKFGPLKPSVPVVLVTVNFSHEIFTGFSLARAMLGDVGAEFSEHGRAEIHHLRRGHAGMTPSHHTLISAILVFDCKPDGDHAIFLNPYAARPLPDDCFPLIRRIRVAREASEAQLTALSATTFWACDESAL